MRPTNYLTVIRRKRNFIFFYIKDKLERLFKLLTFFWKKKC
jgi:hypothetical protein